VENKMEKPNDLNQRINARAFGRAFEAEKKLQERALDEILSKSNSLIKPCKKYFIHSDGLAEPMKSHVDNILKKIDYDGFIKGINEYDK
jgi:hypothetical protein